jgi:hypothetical protein
MAFAIKEDISLWNYGTSTSYSLWFYYIRVKNGYPDKVIESIAEISVLKVELVCASLKKFTACLSVISTSVHCEVNSLSYEQMIENFPVFLLNLFREEL